ncbi:MAG: serine/threonine protein kinase [Planctomycetes bacterium]|nr:serine/threonine protein kinase [Planctomycetota bacterium]
MDDAIQPDARPTVADEVDWTGQVLGEFRVLHRLGRGGMGQVYLAEQTNLKRKVALKLLHPEMAGNERSLLRFKAEAENVARATHANIVQIYTIGQANGVNYIALEYVEGRNLREFIEKKGTPELPLGLHVMSQVAAALQRASELGIIHRDVKPENILLTKKGEVKVADFGLSRCFAEEAQQSITQSQVSMGTPLYMSPEQVERKTVDTRTDIYSFGVTCYHMFAGTPPFRGNSPIEVAYQHVHKEPVPLEEVRPDLPVELCAIIRRMMAKKPEDRYQTAREILGDINALREALNLGSLAAISISSSFIGSASDGLRGAATAPWVEPRAHSPRSMRGLLLGVVALALLLGVAVGWYQNYRAALAVEQPHGKGNPRPDDPARDKKVVSTKEREKELQQRVQEHLNPEDMPFVHAGLKHCIDLGHFYLKLHRLDDADRFFRDISKPERKIPSYRLLGRLGHAVVLAFKDESEGSNKEFLALFADIEKIAPRIGPVPKALRPTKKEMAARKDEIEAYRLLWKDNPSMREMVAKALNHNHANDPARFPARLDRYRFPPRANVKALVGP